MHSSECNPQVPPVYICFDVLRKVRYICIHPAILSCCASLSIHRNQLLYLILYKASVPYSIQVNLEFFEVSTYSFFSMQRRKAMINHKLTTTSLLNGRVEMDRI